MAIRVPRIKSIGYAKVFRKMFYNSTTNSFPAEATGAGADTDIDSGPWNWDFNWEWRIDNLSAAGNWTEDEIGTSNWYRIQSNGYSSFSSAVEETITPPVEGYTKQNWISGRNECAVKFTRVGIPGDMWIRLSVLNTDGTLDLLDSNGFTTAATTEP